MKNQIHLSSCSEARRGNARSIISHRGGAWPGLLLAGCCAVLTGLAHPAGGAVTEVWVHRYNNVVSNSTDQAYKVVSDAAGDVIVTGFTDDGVTGQDMLTIKYSGANGSLLWQKRYNGPANGDDRARAVAVDGSGNVVMTGWGFWNGTNGDYYTAKYAAADGVLLWEQHYDGPVNGPENGGPEDNRDEGRAVAVDGSGNVVVTGVSGWAGSILLGRSKFDFYTAKYAAADGALLWEKRYDGAEIEEFYYLPAVAVAVDSSGNVVLTGAPFSGESDTDYYTAKYAAADGVLLWEKRYSGPANREDSARAVAVDGTGNVVVTGSSISSGRNADFYTAKYAAANGALLWEKRYNGSYNGSIVEGAKAVALDGSGNVVVTGAAQGELYTAKYAAADGALLWEERYNGPSNALAYAGALALDSSGNAVVTGSSEGYYYTAKYAATDGALLWEKRGPAGFARAMALDGTGNVVVTGGGRGGGGFYYHTVKYAAADGALLWEKRGPQVIGGLASAIALDGSGNVVVTGYSYSVADGLDYYTAKYAVADGALLWEKRYNGPANLADSATAVAVDGSGNVVVTGSSFNGTTDYYYTAKYAAADGALLWEIRSIGGGQAVAVDGSGNVVVTGYSGGDYYTAKYAATDGTLLWEIRYSGPANANNFVGGNDSWLGSRGLALGPNGIVAITGSSGGDYATVVYRETLPPLTIERVPTGIHLRFTGVPGSSYTIERGPAVTGPWTTINKQTAPASGLLEYVDVPAPPGQAFYRTVQR